LTENSDFNRSLAKSFGRFAAQLHERGILHHDLNSGNVLFDFKDNTYSFSLIDVNRMTFYPFSKKIPLKDCYDNLTRFCGNLPLFQYVLEEYIAFRKLENPTFELQRALGIKILHDKNWDRRKKFTRKFKKKKI